MDNNNDDDDEAKGSTTTRFPKLLSPLRLGPDLELPNRVIMAPMTRGRADPTTLAATDLMTEYYRQRAASSAGLIITEGVIPSIMGRGWHRAPELFDASLHVEPWHRVTDAVHDAGGRIFCQLWHCGRHSHSSFRDGVDGYDDDIEKKKGIAPSAIPRTSESGKQDFTNLVEAPDLEVPRALTVPEIEQIPHEYRHSATLAKQAGFDGVEIHSSNGFLLDTFLQSCSNQRTDDYGGSPENRFRLIEQVIAACCEVFPAHRVGIRLSPNGAYNCVGSADNHDAFLYYIGRIGSMDLGYLHLTNGIGPPHGLCDVVTFAEVRAIYPGTIIANSGYTAESAEAEIDTGHVDAVSFGRIFLSNPDLVERFASDAVLNGIPDYATWWSTADKQLDGTAGYTDFPTLEEKLEEHPP